ncbi:MAG: EcsC family protein [Hamadaea sp.]|nr:EcsC family protein [Hamadaea sp.]
MRADPQYAPEHLALEAVERIGPAANAWAAALREREPGLAPDAMAHRAVNRFTRHAQLSGAISGAAGLPGAVLDLGVLAWTQCRLVLHVAAAYGVDATHPDRATDLLVLQKVHKAAEGARLALGVATGRERIGSAVATLAGGASRRRAFGQLALKLARMAGVRAVRRLVAKILPFASIILGTWANSAATKELAGRTMEHYQSVSPLLHPAATDPSSAS